MDGQLLQGHVRVTPGRLTIVNSEANTIWHVASTNIAVLSFPTNAMASASVDSGDGSLPVPWRGVDIGYVRLPGSTRHESGIFTVRNSGLNIDGGADSFHFVYKPITNDSEVVAELVSIQYTHPFAKAGLMMRESLHEYAPNLMLAVTAQRGGALQVRMRERENTQVLQQGALAAPVWLKLRRQSNEFSAFISPNGRSWSLVDRVTLPMPEVIYAGLAVAGGREGILNWTTFSHLREGTRLQNEFFTPEVELVSGSIIVGRPTFADENEILFGGAPKVVRASVPRIARVIFQPLGESLAWKTRVSRPGVWVSNGDFIDGDFRSIDGRKLTISSVLYGLRTFDIDDEVLAAVLNPRRFRRAKFDIETADGARVLATDISFADGEFLVQEGALGELRLPAFEILEIRRRP